MNAKTPTRPLEAGTVVDATFRPTKTDDLKPEAVEQIGTRRLWEVMWLIEEDDGRPLYTGQRACYPYNRSARMGWVPECDLEIHAVVTPDA